MNDDDAPAFSYDDDKGAGRADWAKPGGNVKAAGKGSCWFGGGSEVAAGYNNDESNLDDDDGK